jgi:small-conductance mechanosensitive channel
MYALSISDSMQRASDTFFNFLPNLLGFLVLLIIGLIVARIVAGIVRKLLEKSGLDRRLAETQSGRMIENSMPKASAARGIARVIFWLIFGFFLVAAVSALHLASVTVFMNQVLAYLPNVIVAILIFVVAALLAGGASKAIERTMGGSPMGKIAGAVAPALIMVIAMFMILVQLKIAEQIVEIAFAATMGALALGLALAFGLGGRPVAQDMLDEAYRKGREEQARRTSTATTAEAQPSHGARADGATDVPGSRPDARPS